MVFAMRTRAVTLSVGLATKPATAKIKRSNLIAGSTWQIDLSVGSRSLDCF